MENKDKKTETSQGEKTERKQAISKSYLVKAFGENIKKLKETGLVNTNDFEKLKEMHERVVKQYIGFQLIG